MNIAYFGSPEIAASLLKQLLINASKDFAISLAITQPDRPIGKRLEIQPTAVKKTAQAYNIPVFDKNLKESQKELIGLLDKYHIDLCIIFAYGEIINKELLEKPKYGFWNIHPSLLPLYRGPSPAAYAIMNGDSTTGVSIIKLISKLDAGPIIAQVETQIEPYELRNQLEQRLTLIGSNLLISELQNLHKNGEFELKPQNESNATYSSLLKKQDGFISLAQLNNTLLNKKLTLQDCPEVIKRYLSSYRRHDIDQILDNSHQLIYNLYRALTPWPGLWTKIETSQGEKRLLISSATYENNQLIIQKVKLEGKNEVDFKTFNKAYNVFTI